MHLLATCFLALYLAHLVTDFVLQSDRLATGKRRGSILAYAAHGGIHFLTAVLFLGFAVPGQWRNLWFYGFLTGLTLVHLGIDWGKVRLVSSNKIGDGAASFLGDQALHLVTVSATAWLIARPPAGALAAKMHWLQSNIEKPLLLLVVYVGVIFGGGYLVRFLTKPLLKSNVEVIGESTKELQKCRDVHWMAGTIRRAHISGPAIACHRGADPYSEIDCTISRTKVSSFCGVLSDWHTPKCDARDSRWFGIAKGVLR